MPIIVFFIVPSNPQLLGLSAFFACKARNNHLVAHVLVQQKRLRHKSPYPTKRLEVIR